MATEIRRDQPDESYDFRKADFITREAVSNLKGLADLLFYGCIDDESEEDKQSFLVKLKDGIDRFYDILNQDILNKANRVKELSDELEIESNQLKLTNLELQEANNKLFLLANIDMLTGIRNRSALIRRLEEEELRLAAMPAGNDYQMTILFIDLDNFKFYNDSFGHQIGDLVLSEFARLLKNVIGQQDSLARFGGDEFVIMLPGSGLSQSENIARNIRNEMVAKKGFSSEIELLLSRKISLAESKYLSCSIGIAEFRPEIDKSMQSVLIRADQALYQAKKSGKNRYYVWNGNETSRNIPSEPPAE